MNTSPEEITIHIMENSKIVGFVDVLTNRKISGWAFDQSLPDQPLDLKLIIDGAVVNSTIANVHRPDVKNRVGHPSGNCGFVFDVNPTDFEQSLSFENVTVESSKGTLKFAKRVLYRKNLCERRYFFMHIPKTAGTSFRLMLYKQFSQEQIFPNRATIKMNDGLYPSEYALFQESDAINKDICLITGHYRYMCSQVFAEMPEIIVFLRNPIDRVVSNMMHWKRKRYNNASLKKLIDLYPIQVDNLQVRYFANNLTTRPVSEADLSLAKQNLEKCSGLGIVERFDESIALFNKIYGWNMGRSLSANTSGGKKYDVDSEDMEFLISSNAYDQELYDYAIELFERRI